MIKVFFNYQLMHKTAAFKRVIKFTLNTSNMFLCDHHHQGAYCVSLLQLQCYNIWLKYIIMAAYVTRPAVKNMASCTAIIRYHHHHHHHRKHQGLDPLIHSVSRVTAARVNASSVFQLFSFLVVCSGMISKGFGFVAFFASVKAS